MFTPEGLAWTSETLAERLDGACRIAVGDGGENITSSKVTKIEVNGPVITLTAVFDEDQANFEWAFRDVIYGEETIVDHIEEDQGRKVPGSVWTAQAEITLEV